MDERASRTAITTAVARGRHRLYDERPWILDDPYALPLVGPIWRLVERRTLSQYPEDVEPAYRAGIVARSRYAEDRLEAGGYRQYVILGAGLDSFAWRRPDMARSLAVFEVDHPASQAAKRERAEVLGLPETPGPVYVPVDLETDALDRRLEEAGFDWEAPTCFSWLGVTMYLTVPAIEATLRTIGRSVPGSEIVFTYAPTDEHMDEVGRRFDAVVGPLVAAVGEPLVTHLSRRDVESLVIRAGLAVAEHPTNTALVERYFAGRPDGLRPYTAEGIVAAQVPPAD